MFSWLVHLSSDRAVQLQTMVGTLCCVLGQDTLLSWCLFPPRGINGCQRPNARGNPVMDQRPIQGGVEILLVASCYRNRDKLWPNELLDWHSDLTCMQTLNC